MLSRNFHWINGVVLNWGGLEPALMGLIHCYTEEVKVSQPGPSSSQTKPEPINLSKCVVKLFLHQSGDVAAKFEYNAVSCSLFCLLYLI